MKYNKNLKPAANLVNAKKRSGDKEDLHTSMPTSYDARTPTGRLFHAASYVERSYLLILGTLAVSSSQSAQFAWMESLRFRNLA